MGRVTHLEHCIAKGVFGTALQTLLHKLHYRAAPQKTEVCGVPL